MKQSSITFVDNDYTELLKELKELKDIAITTNQLLLQDREKIDNLNNTIDKTNSEIKIAQNNIHKVEELVAKPSFLSRIGNNLTKMATGAVMGAGLSLITGGSAPVLAIVGASGHYLISKIIG